jgi:hypothetical protein
MAARAIKVSTTKQGLFAAVRPNHLSFFIYDFSFEHLWTEKSPFQGYFQQKSYTRLDVILSAEMTK